MADDRVRLPNARRISFQPVMALGLDGTELIAVIASGFLIMAGSLVVAILVIQVLHFSMLMSAGAGFAGAFALRGMLIRTKRETPDGFALQKVQQIRRTIGSEAPGLLNNPGAWDCRRHDL